MTRGILQFVAFLTMILLTGLVAAASVIEDHVVTVDNLRLHYIESGSGRNVVLIHGNAGNAMDFELGAVDALAARHHVIAIDRPGHGESERPDGLESLDDHARLLHAELTALRIDRPVLVGHSWGGSLALAYALAYPSEVSGLVLLAPAAFPDKSEPFFLRIAGKVPVIGEIGAFLGRSVFSKGVLRKDLERAFYPQAVPEGYFQTVRRSWLGRKQLKAYFADEAKLDDSLKKMTMKYASITVPTTIVTGDQDRIVDPRENAYRLNWAIKGSKLIVLGDTGHEIPQTHPESILDAMGIMSRN